MKVATADRRVIDCYVALMEGLVEVDTPYGKVLCPEGLAGPDWVWRQDIKYDSFVPSFTRDFTSGGPILAKYSIPLQSDGDHPLEDAIRALVLLRFGPEIDDLPLLKKPQRKRKTK